MANFPSSFIHASLRLLETPQQLRHLEVLAGEPGDQLVAIRARLNHNLDIRPALIRKVVEPTRTIRESGRTGSKNFVERCEFIADLVAGDIGDPPQRLTDHIRWRD